jgi:hypothetical protein
MWSSRSERLDNRRTVKVAIDLDSSPVSYSDVLRRWQNDAEFRSFFVSLLAHSPYSAFRWETPPITTATVAGLLKEVTRIKCDLVMECTG